ncbi:hypothetical protein HZS_412 [Henneguya salminicola]|nr:hypothetical protein HZS_412 [Henneguya salminicola]
MHYNKKCEIWENKLGRLWTPKQSKNLLTLIVENMNQKSIKQVKNNQFERDDEYNLGNCHSTSNFIGLHTAIGSNKKNRM